MKTTRITNTLTWEYLRLLAIIGAAIALGIYATNGGTI